MSLINADIGSPIANCYIELADALVRYGSILGGQAFIDLGDPDKQEQILIQATQRIERITDWDYAMIGTSRVSNQQALTFPRIGTYNREGDAWYPPDIIPPFIIDALLEQGLAEQASDRDAEPPGRGIKRMKADTLEIEYDDSASQSQHPITDTVYTILDPWLLGTPAGGDKYYLYNTDINRV